MEADQAHGAAAAGQPHALHDVGHRAHARERVVMAWHEHHALLVPDLEGERQIHGGEDDRVVHRHEQELTAYALKTLADIPGVRVFGLGGPEGRGGTVSFDLAGVHPQRPDDAVGYAAVVVG